MIGSVDGEALIVPFMFARTAASGRRIFRCIETFCARCVSADLGVTGERIDMTWRGLFKRPYAVCWLRRTGEIAILATFAKPSSVDVWMASRIGRAWRETREALWVEDRRAPARRNYVEATE